MRNKLKSFYQITNKKCSDLAEYPGYKATDSGIAKYSVKGVNELNNIKKLEIR